MASEPTPPVAAQTHDNDLRALREAFWKLAEEEGLKLADDAFLIVHSFMLATTLVSLVLAPKGGAILADDWRSLGAFICSIFAFLIFLTSTALTAFLKFLSSAKVQNVYHSTLLGVSFVLFALGLLSMSGSMLMMLRAMPSLGFPPQFGLNAVWMLVLFAVSAVSILITLTLYIRHIKETMQRFVSEAVSTAVVPICNATL